VSLRIAIFSLAGTGFFVLALTGCSTIAEKTNFISDDQIKSKVGGTLGAPPETITLVSRRTAGTDTYVEVRLQNNRVYSCTLNGGNALTMGIINPPQCNPKS
jgi:hypothetical protein